MYLKTLINSFVPSQRLELLNLYNKAIDTKKKYIVSFLHDALQMSRGVSELQGKTEGNYEISLEDIKRLQLFV